FGNLREVLDVVDRHTQPGPVRDGFYRRFLRTEMLGRLGGRKLLAAEPAFRTALLDEVRRLMEERFPAGVDAGLGAAVRARAALVRAGRLEELVALAEEMSQLTVDVQVNPVRVVPGAALALTVQIDLLHRGQPLVLDRSDSGRWLLPRSVVGLAVSDTQREVDPGELRGDLVVQHRELLDEWFLPAPLRPVLDPEARTVRWTGEVRLDPASGAGGEPLRPGVHDLIGRVEVFGLTRNRRGHAPAETRESAAPLLVDCDGRVHRLLVRAGGQLALEVDARHRRLARALAGASVTATATGRVTAVLPVVWARPPKVSLVLVGDDEPISVRLQQPTPAGVEWSAAQAPRSRLRAGTYRAALTLSAPPRRVELEAPVTVEPPRAGLGRTLRDAGGLLHHLPKLVARRLPSPGRSRGSKGGGPRR
ncbi:MAG: hypothetical protein ACLGIF_01670, partial [Actinomycetes bacterium]